MIAHRCPRSTRATLDRFPPHGCRRGFKRPSAARSSGLAEGRYRRTDIRRTLRVSTILLAAAILMAVTVAHPLPASAARPTLHPAAVPTCQPYPDVDQSNSACENIAWLKTMGITKPADGLYHPLHGVTRGAMTAFLFRLVHPGAAGPPCTVRPFPDVPVDSTFCGYITWAKARHIVFGYSNGDYGTSRAVTRGAMAAYLNRMAESTAAPRCTTRPFNDVPVDSVFCGVITWMKTTGITYGVGEGKYGPGLPVTRQAMASFLHRAVDLGYLKIPAPVLTLTVVNDQVSAGAAPVFTYTATNVPAPATVVLQMRDLTDTTPTWSTVTTIPTGSGIRGGPKVNGWGTRDYRLRVIDYGAVLGTSGSVQVTVYTKVRLTTLCTYSATVYVDCPSSGTIPVGDHEFHYVGGEIHAGPFDTTQWTEFLSSTVFTCRSVTLRFASNSTFTDISNLQELRVWSDFSKQWYTATTNLGEIGSLTVPLHYSGFQFALRSDPYSPLPQDIYVDGWASCSTPHGYPVFT